MHKAFWRELLFILRIAFWMGVAVAVAIWIFGG